MSQQPPIPPESVEALRREYAREKLDESHVQPDPIDQFENWFQQALASEVLDANAVALATATSSGIPSVRIVLLKGYDRLGFRFFTNYESNKGRELAENPHAALCFYWAPLERQVRVKGVVEKLSREESEEYFHQRPRLSQLGAWASRQSTAIHSREQLSKAFSEVEERFADETVPIPDYWGGFVLKPNEIEFWQGRPGRLHDRLLYTKSSGGWKISRLSP